MTRRMTLLVLAIVGLMVLIVTVSPPRTASERGSESSAGGPSASAPIDDPEELDVTATVDADEQTLQEQTIEAELGDDIEIVVEGQGPGSVALGDLETEPYEEGLPARFRLLAQTTGAYPLVLVDEGRQIGTLEIK